MENRNVGFMIIGIAVLLIVIIFLYDNALKEIVKDNCGDPHSLVCPMNKTIDQQTYLALGIVGFLVIVAIILIVSKPHERIVIQEKTIKVKVPFKEKKKEFDMTNLDSEEKKVIEFLKEENGTMFQASLMEKLSIGKVGMTRLLDKLEAKQYIERKRRGMNNVVVLRG